MDTLSIISTIATVVGTVAAVIGTVVAVRTLRLQAQARNNKQQPNNND